MGKKKRGHPDLDELLGRPWCYYCERDFEDLKLLISHQKAKHFKCDRCGKRLNTAGGLSVHMNQVHKESLNSVENALPNRQGLDIEIFGMEGVPEDIIQQHNQRIIQNFYTAQAERFAATGNPPAGQSGGQGAVKKIKYETSDELKKRLAEHRSKLASGANGGAAAGALDGQLKSSGGIPYAPPGTTPFPPSQSFNPSYPPGASPSTAGAPGAFNLPARPPGSSAATPNLPQRPPYGGASYAPGAPGLAGNASTVDELVAGASRGGDDIDQMIRRAVAGVKPDKNFADETAPAEKKGKKEKNMRMIYSDSEISPEEKMAMMPRYAFTPEMVA